jgi:hypothetical protein
LRGVGALATSREHTDYQLPDAQDERLPVEIETTRQRYFYTLESSHEQTEALLEQVSSLWLKEVRR